MFKFLKHSAKPISFFSHLQRAVKNSDVQAVEKILKNKAISYPRCKNIAVDNDNHSWEDGLIKRMLDENKTSKTLFFHKTEKPFSHNSLCKKLPGRRFKVSK